MAGITGEKLLWQSSKDSGRSKETELGQYWK